MATGDQTDIVGRLRGYLPSRWFGSPSDVNPIRDAVLQGLATCLSYLYGLYQYAKLQTRIATATDGWLDMISADFFGTALPRQTGESDTSFRSRIQANLVQEKATRNGISKALMALTGRTPVIVEPWRPLDTGVYATLSGPFGAPIGYSVAGSYGSLKCNAQAFITAYRPHSGQGIASIAGYGVSMGAYNTASQINYASLTNWTAGVRDSDIYAAVAATKAEGTIMWVRISN